MEFKDHFSKVSKLYSKYRPSYPDELFQYLVSISPSNKIALDCATGSGQAALALAKYFEHVIATDASSSQIANAFQHEKIEYRVATAEDSKLDDESVDLVTAAQAVHWFNFENFFKEARRVLKPDGIIAFWTYSHLHSIHEIDSIIGEFYIETINPYWPPERKFVEEHYKTIPFSFSEISAPQFEIRDRWTLHNITGYLNSWSAVQRYTEVNGFNPVDQITGELAKAWGDPDSEKLVRWDLHIRVGKKEK